MTHGFDEQHDQAGRDEPAAYRPSPRGAHAHPSDYHSDGSERDADVDFDSDSDSDTDSDSDGSEETTPAGARDTDSETTGEHPVVPPEFAPDYSQTYDQPAFAPASSQPYFQDQPQFSQPQFSQPQFAPQQNPQNPQQQNPQYPQPGQQFPVPAPQYPIPPQGSGATPPPEPGPDEQSHPQPGFGAPQPYQPAPQQQPQPNQPQPNQQQPSAAVQPYQQPSQPVPYTQPGQGYADLQHPGFAPPPQQPAPIPRPEDLLVPDVSPVHAEPASHGWRGRVNRMSGGMIKSKASEAELQLRQAITDIQRGFSRPMTVVVVQPKGGAGKTPTTICLASAFGAYRGGYVVGWDDNETRGTLAVRVSNPDSQRATVWDLLSDLSAFERFDARVGDLSYYVRPQPDAHFDALVSDDNPGNMAQIGEQEYQRLHTVLQRFYRLIVVDTGNNVRSPNWQAAINSADVVVVVSTYQRDVGYSGSWVLDHLEQTGRQNMAHNTVTVLTAADPSVDKTVRSQLLEHFTARTRAVCEIPYDTELAHGGPIRWTQLASTTRSAWTLAGATIANCLAEIDRADLEQRRSHN